MTTAVIGLRRGIPYWWDSYASMVKWELTSLRLVVPVATAVQILTGAGFIFGIDLLFGGLDQRAALYLSTGVLVITLITVGMVMGPQFVAQAKASDQYDFLWSLPVPRTTAALAWLTINSIIAIPGMVIAVLAALWRFDLPLVISPAVIPAVVIVLLTGTMVGYAFSHAISSPLAINMISQMLIFVILGFSPINYPIDRLPGWFAALHGWLPFHHMAEVIRAGLTEGLVTDVTRSYLTLGGWSVLAVITTALVLGRRS
jgi:ABC-2 type transport system permease protein